MNKSIPRTYGKEEEKSTTMEQVLSKYNSTAKKVGLNILDIKPNHAACKLIKYIQPLIGVDGKELIMPGSDSTADELVLEVIIVGVQNNTNAMEVKIGDRVVVKNGYPTIFKASTQLLISGVETPILHVISTDDVLYKVDYFKRD